MNTLHEISNKDILKELNERIKKGEIKFEGNRMMGKLREGDSEENTVYYGIFLKINIVRIKIISTCKRYTHQIQLILVITQSPT